MISTSVVLVILLQAVGAEPAVAAKPIVLKAARLFDGKSDAVTSGATVIVEGKTIKAVGTGLTASRRCDGDRPGRCHPLPRLHRRAHPPDS